MSWGFVTLLARVVSRLLPRGVVGLLLGGVVSLTAAREVVALARGVVGLPTRVAGLVREVGLPRGLGIFVR